MKNHIRFIYQEKDSLSLSVFDLHVTSDSITEHLKISFSKKCGSDNLCPHFFGSCQKIIDVKKVKYRNDLFLYYNLKNVGYIIGRNGLEFIEKPKVTSEQSIWILINNLVKSVSSVDFFNRIEMTVEQDISGENVKLEVSQENLNRIKLELIYSLKRAGIQIIE